MRAPAVLHCKRDTEEWRSRGGELQQNWAWKDKYDLVRLQDWSFLNEEAPPSSAFREMFCQTHWKKKIKHNVLHPKLLSSKGEVCISKCHFSGRKAAGRSFPFNTNQIILQAFWETEAMLLPVACSVAVTNSPGSWQEVTLGNATHWSSILNVDPKRMRFQG